MQMQTQSKNNDAIQKSDKITEVKLNGSFTGHCSKSAWVLCNRQTDRPSNVLILLDLPNWTINYSVLGQFVAMTTTVVGTIVTYTAGCSNSWTCLL